MVSLRSSRTNVFFVMPWRAIESRKMASGADRLHLLYPGHGLFVEHENLITSCNHEGKGVLQ